MSSPAETIRIAATDCLTAFGDADATLAALLRGERALRPLPALGRDGGAPVPLALIDGRSLDETAPPAWLTPLEHFAKKIPGGDWGAPRRPVFVTSSNFGVGSLHALRRNGEKTHLATATPHATIEFLQARLGWEKNIAVLSHACVSAQLGLFLAARQLDAGQADEALLFSFDFLSPFVTGGFQALKILNCEFPAPYQARPSGAIGLGDGAAFAVLTRDRGDLAIAGQSLHNEMHHFTANQTDGAGFVACLAPLAKAAARRRVWLKGHGTGTLEAGRLEAEAFARLFPDAPLVSWKGSLGHTLGSCALVELALAAAALRSGRTPGTIGSAPPAFIDAVRFSSFDNCGFDAVVCASNAFGGAHGALLLSQI
ncbi:MAG: hypothetical protein KGJ37_05120 [Verrucomicrobiota bacterium]|nr:hypothetical protein [Verrucomicrobiota bacterium]